MPQSLSRFFLLIGPLLLIFSASSARAQVRIIGGGDYPTIKDALSAGATGDILEVDTGVYLEHDLVISYPVTIRSRSPFSGFPQVTIDASGLGRHFLVQADCTLDGLRLRNGDVSGAGDGGAILQDSGVLTLRNCVVQVSAADSGGGIAVRGGHLELIGTKVRLCTATGSGGGIHVDGTTGTSLTISGSSILENQSGATGGGLSLVDCPVELHASEILDNQASADGGGLSLVGTLASGTMPSAIMSSVTISRNIAAGSGGGVFTSQVNVGMNQVFAEYNHCNGPASNSLGGGIYLDRVVSDMVDCHVSFNSSTGAGGGLCLLNGNDAGFIPGVIGSRLKGCVIQQNTAGQTGGGVEVRFSGRPAFDGCQIFDNLADSGGAFRILRMTATSTPTPQIQNSFVCGNDAPQFSWNLGSSTFDDLGGNTILETCSPSYGGEGEIPDPNPVANTDGTFTWYVGNNTQYPEIQSVIDASHPGDEIIVMGGLYVESLSLDLPDITLRCSTTPGGDGPEAGFQKVVFWNPTEGFENDNSAAIVLGSNTQNTYVGRPRQFTQLANGSIVPTLVPFGGGLVDAEFSPDAVYLPLCNNEYGRNSPMTRTQLGLAGYLGDELAMEFWSRSIDDYAIRAHDSEACISFCKVTSQNGFGGGILLMGEGNATSLVGCRIVDTFSGGVTHDGYGVHGVAIHGGNPMFAGCVVSRNTAGAGSGARAMVLDEPGGGVIHQEGGRGLWSGCLIGGRGYQDMNSAPVANGIYVITKGASPHFSRCTIRCNLSRFGTIYFDSTENEVNENLLFTRCDFLENITVSTQYGAVAWCVDDVEGRSPLITFDLCRWFNSNESGTETGYEYWEKDVWSNYFPRYRLLRGITKNRLSSSALNLYGAGASFNLAGDLNNDGRVDGLDLAALLAAW